MERCSKQCLNTPTLQHSITPTLHHSNTPSLRRPGSERVALRRRSRDGLGVSRTYEAPGQDGRKEHEQCTGQKQGVITVSKTRDGQRLDVGRGVAWKAEP
jgi:hypothetical protein